MVMPARQKSATPQFVQSDHETAGWITRQQAVDLLGVALQTLVNWENKGLLTPKRAMRGSAAMVIVYDPVQLARVPHKHRTPLGNEPGELTARVFEMLDNGKSVRDIVIEHRQTVDHIQDLRERWLDTGGADRVISPVAWKEFERLAGPFTTVAELLGKLGEKIVIDVDPESALGRAIDAEIEMGIVKVLDAATTPKVS